MAIKQIIWKHTARAKYLRTTRWYFDNMGLKAADSFMRGIAENVERISRQSAIGKREPLLVGHPEDFRSLVVHRHTKIIYYCDTQNVYIVDLWDCRQNPAKLKIT
ncbi:toxin ParE1/3/4 [Parabacteroides sp. PF5-5]|uniref:type II toxin-antitoxin system RelE/ParE family toxin n=1 Tax=unclassified Parabacteroides TaxID=2649774 RepID=UPI002473B105|nr:MULTISPECIES: type II toxin-antitoxin system RelE/ParE family toxin [unclassified Parabacteroides]MDH6306313.1 toxin ParE1/3/4 [Parabacteroides sp. PH5-39]MDH6316896.1 toxin ParE1/3/4 [Parabacteroides sp. PF5-13]MDH6320965.1 toxin ParE1/3/4 [Parabacteroides sp. PH5-13]MDH6324697.1 toxin ParE1/3/4 [Parabacteroides sp. PH5-8]MDH6328081.1 toxin ParE1/3/4 [Parabacteroides sp. PH5-41]